MTSMDKEEIQYMIANPSHRDGIVELMSTVFFPTEPVAAALNLTWTDCKGVWEKLIDECSRNGQSHVAVDVSGRVIGARLSRIIDLSKLNPSDDVYQWEDHGIPWILITRSTRNWCEALGGRHRKRCMQFVGLCVHPDYAGRGVALRMTRENLVLAKSLGCDSCMANASNFRSQRVFENAGFELVDSMPYKEFCDEEGKPYLTMNDNRNTCYNFYVMKF